MESGYDIQNIWNVISIFLNKLYWRKSMIIHLHIVNSCCHAMVMEFSLYLENPGVYLLPHPLQKSFENSISNL